MKKIKKPLHHHQLVPLEQDKLVQFEQSYSESLLKMAQLHAEKCDLQSASTTFLVALNAAKKNGDLKSVMEALAGLFRLSGEALDEKAIEKWDLELDRQMRSHPKEIPPMTWFCKGGVARHRGQSFLAQRWFHRYLRSVRLDASGPEDQIARGWLMLAVVLSERGKMKRSFWLIQEVLNRYEEKNIRGLNGIAYLHLGALYEIKKEYKTALYWFQKAHGQFMGEHNWYYHLYSLYGYARIARHQQKYSQAIWYLDLVDKAVSAPGFGLLRREIAAERKRLEQDAVDLLIDSRKGVIKTRETGTVMLRKQHVLLHILEALSKAHKKSGNDFERGLSKAEIIEYVWREPYRPGVHDNKLYYNINRIRKLIEPDVRKPRYLLNWKEGYRLAPSLRIHFVGTDL